MKKIVRTYAIIYIDEEGESLNFEDYSPESIINEYYNTPGFLQWNYYLIIPKELVKENEIELIENNERYTRKHVIESDKIEDFITNRFPIFNKDSHGLISLIKGNSWRKACDLAVSEMKINGGIPQSSWYRDESLDYSLIQMDKLRARLILNPKMRVIFYTHLSNEFSIAEKKFKLFCDINN